MINPLKLARMNKGKKQYELANEVGISQTDLSTYELGKRKVRVELKYRFAKILETPVEQLFPEGG